MIRFFKRMIWKVKQVFVKRKIVKQEDAVKGTGILISENKLPYDFAQEELGTKEIKGRKHNPRVVEYHQTCTLKATDDETAWCSAFVNWCFWKAKIKDRSRSAMAISWLDIGESIDEPRIGDVVIFKRRGSSWKGHVGFFVKESRKNILVLGGNQSNEVNYQWYPKSGTTIYLAGYRRIQE